MEQSFRTDIINKEEKYQHFLPDWKLLIDGETDEIAVLANTCAALREAFGFFWIGFYLVKNGQLVLVLSKVMSLVIVSAKVVEYVVPPGLKPARK